MAIKSTTLERHADAELGGEGNANRRAGAEEIAQRPGRNAQLVQAGDGLGLRASRIEAKCRGVALWLFTRRRQARRGWSRSWRRDCCG